MKKLILLAFLSIISYLVLAQAPQGFNYQALYRDATGTPYTNQNVAVIISILQGAVDGTQVFTETHSATTNEFGLLTLTIGSVNTVDFKAIGWSSGSYFLKVSINGNHMGVSQLMSVPFAHHAISSDVFTGNEIKNLIDPVDDQDAATKAYVDQYFTSKNIYIQAEIDSLECFGDADGGIDLTITGGTPPFYFEWDNGENTEDLSDLSQGLYQVYVEDANGITAFRHFRLQTPPEIIIDYLDAYAGGNIDITVSGGIPPYTYLWSNGSTSEDLSGVEPGDYTVQVTDNIGCVASAEIGTLLESLILIEYIEASITPASLPAYITAAALDDKILVEADMLILDIRSAAKWVAGHITGAVNVPDSKLLLDYLVDNSVSMDKEIYVVGYSGQTAAWGTALLRVAGYSNAKSLKFGMSSWTTMEGYDSWSGNISDAYWTNMVQTTSAAKPAAGDLPDLSEGFDNGADILDARLNTVFAEGFGAICATDAGTIMGGFLYDNPNYFIINYWSEAHYLVGHIPNAVNYEPSVDPFTLGIDLKTLPTDKAIIVYGYTGQTSAYMVAYLRLLGYDARTLKFGANSMMNEHMPAARWFGPLTPTPTVTVDRLLVVE